MDAFIQATAWRHEAFLGTGGGDIWRIWFDHDGQPLMQKLTPDQIREYREAIDGLGLDRPQAAIENLTLHQEQCDMDGVMVKVSRQALDETLTYLRR